MLYNGYELALLFFTYAFLGWLAETVIFSLAGKRFLNRGFGAAPFCILYGLIGLCVAVLLKDLRKSVVLLFVGSSTIATMLQWIGGLFLEHLGKGRWWDYSGMPLNINGYVAFPVSAVFGGMGTLALLFGNDLFIGLYRLLPVLLRKLIVWILLAVCVLDVLVSALSFLMISRRLVFTRRRIGNRIADLAIRRVRAAYPDLQLYVPVVSPVKDAAPLPAPAPAAGRLTRFEVFWIFVIGALGGDFVETLFMRVTKGIWMSRSSLVWGTFSVVWGIAAVLGSVLLGREQERSDSYLFLTGTLLGGTYEYACSVFTELLFGAVFWDYSAIPFNIGGRVNLLYCFFWGIGTVAWVRLIFPGLHRLLGYFYTAEGRVLTGFMVLFMIANVMMSCGALIRYNERANGAQARNAVAVYLDHNYDDALMEHVYPGAKRR